MVGSDHCYFFLATIHVLMANSNDVNLAKTRYVHYAWPWNRRLVLIEYTNSAAITRIGRFYHMFALWNTTWQLFTGAQPPVLKCRRFLSFFQRYIARDISLTEIYRRLVTFARSLKSYPPFWKARGMEDSQERDCSFFFPNLYDGLVYERKFKSEYLERQIYERSLKSELSIVKLIEDKSDLSKLSTLSEPSIVKFIENQSYWHHSVNTLL